MCLKKNEKSRCTKKSHPYINFHLCPRLLQTHKNKNPKAEASFSCNPTGRPPGASWHRTFLQGTPAGLRVGAEQDGCACFWREAEQAAGSWGSPIAVSQALPLTCCETSVPHFPAAKTGMSDSRLWCGEAACKVRGLVLVPLQSAGWR